jgi:hypothetical protein
MNVMAAANWNLPATTIDIWSLLRAAGRGARSGNSPDPLRPTETMYAERLVISAGVDPLRSVRCPRCTPTAIVVGGVQEGRAYERKAIEAIMAEKPMVSEAEPRKPRREPSMHKMRTREPAPAEVHAAARGAEMHSSGHTAGMHAPSHAATMHTTPATPTAASQCR